MVLVLNRLGLAQGLHAPFVATSALVIFALGVRRCMARASSPSIWPGWSSATGRRARTTPSWCFSMPVTWLAQIVMFVLLGLLVLAAAAARHALARRWRVAVTLMLFARPVAVFLLPAPFRFPGGRKRSSPGSGCAARSASFWRRSRCWLDLPNAQLYFNIAFVVVLTSLLVQGWSIALGRAASLHVALPRHDHMPRRVELDLPGQLEQEIVGYPVGRQQPLSAPRAAAVLGAADAGGARRENPRPRRGRSGAAGRLHLSAGAAGKGAGARPFFRRHAAAGTARSALLGDFFVTGDHTLGELAQIYGLEIAPEEAAMSLADFFAMRIKQPKQGDILPLGPIALIAHGMTDGRVTSVGLRLVDEVESETPVSRWGRCKRAGASF